MTVWRTRRRVRRRSPVAVLDIPYADADAPTGGAGSRGPRLGHRLDRPQPEAHTGTGNGQAFDCGRRDGQGHVGQLNQRHQLFDCRCAFNITGARNGAALGVFLFHGAL